MIDRYENNDILSNDVGQQYLSTSILSEIEPSINDIYIISKRGDRLEHYADKYYNGDVSKWIYIARANYIGKGTTVVDPNLQIRIPMNIDKIKTNDALLNI